MVARNAGTNVEVHILSHVRPILWGEKNFSTKNLGFDATGSIKD